MRRLEVQGFLFRECGTGIDDFHGGAVLADERVSSLHWSGDEVHWHILLEEVKKRKIVLSMQKSFRMIARIKIGRRVPKSGGS